MLRKLVFSLLTAVAMLSCQNQAKQSSDSTANTAVSNPTDCRTIEHKLGQTEICGQPERIVVLGPYVLEPLLALEVQPVGYADYIALHQGDYTDPSQQIPYLGDRIASLMDSRQTQPLVNVGLTYAPSIEAILKVQPDLILGISWGENDHHYETLAQIAPTLLFEYFEPEQNLRAIALAVNRTEQAEQLLTQAAQRMEAAKETFHSLAETHPKVALLSTSDLREIWVTTGSQGDKCAETLENLGFQFVFPPGLSNDKVNPFTAPISLESLPQLNDADLVILLGQNLNNLKQFEDIDDFKDHQLSDLKQAWQKNAISQSLDASQAGRVYFAPVYLCGGLPGPIGTELYLEELKQQLLGPNKNQI